jgi:hypothetical protein
MDRKARWIGAGALALAAIGGATGFAIASSDDDRPLTGPALEEARRAALAHTGGGAVIETEIGDDGSAYGVEVRRDDGSVVEVALDADFRVIGDEADEDAAGERETADD